MDRSAKCVKRPGGVRPLRGASTPSAIEVHITSAFVTGASGTKKTPSGKAAPSRWATAIANRVLPDPPGPVSVTSRTPGERSSVVTASASASLPISGVAGTGRLDAAPTVFSAG